MLKLERSEFSLNGIRPKPNHQKTRGLDAPGAFIKASAGADD